MSYKLNWEVKKFKELSPTELYAILQLRNEVFVVEQNCVYPDLDNKDQSSFHLMAWNESKLIAYTRLIPPGIAYPLASIGRVVNSPAARGLGIGIELMQRSILECNRLFGNGSIQIGAQLYLKNFYKSLGFNPSGEVYLEDGIEHVEMTRTVN